MATRRYAGTLQKTLTPQDLQQGAQVPDHTRLEAELDEIFNRISQGDPQTDTQVGNFEQKYLLITAPAAVDTERAYAHGIGAALRGWEPVGVVAAGYRYLASLYATRASDAEYVYFAVSSAAEASKKGYIRIW